MPIAQFNLIVYKKMKREDMLLINEYSDEN